MANKVLYRTDADHEKMIREWFKDHEIEVKPCGDGELLTWSKAGSSFYMVQYLILRNTLIVLGDLGSAIYYWSGQIDHSFLAGLGLGYFASKCIASEVGEDFKQWDDGLAKSRFVKHLANVYRMTERRALEIAEENGIEFDKLGFQGSIIQRPDIDNEPSLDIDMRSLFEAGQRIHVRCQSHLIGLKMAWQQRAAQQAGKRA